MLKRVLTSSLLLAAALALCTAPAIADGKAEKRQKLDTMAAEELEELFGESPGAKRLFEQAEGYAVFSNLKVAVGISGGGGNGVAVDKQSGSRTYMKMGTGGIGLGLGSQRYIVVFLFETRDALNAFLDNGWQASTQASAAAGDKGAGVATTFHDGVALYQMTEKGLIASADVSGTKYWKNKKLN